MRTAIAGRSITRRPVTRTVMPRRTAAAAVTAHTGFQGPHAVFRRQVGNDLDNGEFDLAFHVTASVTQFLHRRSHGFGVEGLLTQGGFNRLLRISDFAQPCDHVIAARAQLVGGRFTLIRRQRAQKSTDAEPVTTHADRRTVTGTAIQARAI